MVIQKIEIIRDNNNVLKNINGISYIENLINEYKKENLPNADSAYHHEAEIAAGLKYLIMWLKSKE